jgi:hypothetical protein
MLRSHAVVRALVAVSALFLGCRGASGLVTQANTAANLKDVFQQLRAAQLSGDTAKAAAITRGLLPDEARLRRALKQDVPAETIQKVLAFYRAMIPQRDAELAKLLAADPANTEVRVGAATTEEMAKYAEGSVAFDKFPGAVKDLAPTLLRPGLTFYEVELVKPGERLGMKYHLFFWDGQRWAMLGPIWRALR